MGKDRPNGRDPAPIIFLSVFCALFNVLNQVICSWDVFNLKQNSKGATKFGHHLLM